jgi:hypothetical protein
LFGVLTFKLVKIKIVTASPEPKSVHPEGCVEKVGSEAQLEKWVFVGTALVAVRFKVRTGIHPEGQALSLRCICSPK